MPIAVAPEDAACWHAAYVVMEAPQPEQSVAPDGAKTYCPLPQLCPHVGGGGAEPEEEPEQQYRYCLLYTSPSPRD